MAAKMKAIVVEGPNCIRMAEVDKPEPGVGDVLIKVAYTGVCGTDAAILKGEIGNKKATVRYPVRIGHEWSGIVEKTGAGVSNVKPGDRVVSEPGVSCGVCVECAVGRYDKCRRMRSIGTFDYCWDGAFGIQAIRDLHKDRETKIKALVAVNP